ncbi:L-aspartate oxidase [Solicola gregarius]|uniref:L-aspartate oxidase n=1 Tax=Solicola gregarius TaxID=2908642 RepID=A0AA46TKH9_9ACTN|nr:L-aspartate oxidase [Solicola gregarius]UYM06982.1 L-aspartate oxidase [Solicola gregarius]
MTWSGADVRLPSRLAAPAPGWRTTADVVVIGSGIAGLSAALRAQTLGRVVVVTKDRLHAGSTRFAQGGIASAIDPGDSPDEHLRDTLTAGAGLCAADAVRVLVDEGADAVRELIDWGAELDRGDDGRLSLTREGGHRRARIAHAGGDATGAEIQRALVAAVRAAPSIEVIEHAFALDVLTDGDGAAVGVTLHVLGEGERDGVGAVDAGAVILATGGMGQVYRSTTNPTVSTGDGIGLGLRAGASVRDMEFVQFHPTVLWLGESARGRQPLVSEAVRGEGAFLVDATGDRFMADVHELGDLAPRDVVAKGIMRRMLETGEPHMWLDGRHLGADFWQRRFPTVLAACRSHGIDPATRPIPVVPACHYASGGVVTDVDGRTRVRGLYACGEAASSGVHGANRLASNSLLEGLVFSRRIVAALESDGPVVRGAAEPHADAGVLDAEAVPELQEIMTAGVGVLRDRDRLDAAVHKLTSLAVPGRPRVEDWQATNLVTAAAAIALAARERRETRGSHWRDDYPHRDDTGWAGHLETTLQDGLLRTTLRRAEVTDGQ